MKRLNLVIVVLLILIVSVLPFSVSAKTKAGAKPGSFFYFFDKVLEKTSLFFTFNPEKKAKKTLEYAEERLAEAEELKKEKEEKETTENKKEITEIKKEKTEISEKEVEKTDNKLKEEEQNEEQEEQAKIKDDKKDEVIKKDGQSKEIEKLKKEIEVLKQKTSQIKVVEKIVEKPAVVESKQSSSSQAKQKEITLPNGAVMEIDENGKVVRTIKEAPEQTYAPQITNNTTALNISVGDVKITSSSAHLEWKTNIPTDSKVFLNQPDDSIKVFSSASGNSTIHFVDISNIISGTFYKYTIEAIAGIQNKKIDGSFTTNQQTFLAESVKSSTNPNDTVPFLKFSSDRPFTIKKLVFLDDGTYCRSGYSFTVLTLQYLSVGRDAKKELAGSMGRFIFDFPDGLTSSSITFRLTSGTDNLQSSYCFTEGMKFVLRDSESIILSENGKQINIPHVVLIGK